MCSSDLPAVVTPGIVGARIDVGASVVVAPVLDPPVDPPVLDPPVVEPPLVGARCAAASVVVVAERESVVWVVGACIDVGASVVVVAERESVVWVVGRCIDVGASVVVADCVGALGAGAR